MNYNVFNTPTQNMLAGVMSAFARYDVPGVSGMPEYGGVTAGTDQRIPWAFSRIYRDKFYDACVVTNICNTKFSGEIKALGDTVVINTIPDVYVGDYYRGKVTQWQLATSPAVVMKVNRASDFAVVQDDVDKKQFWDKDFLGTLAKDAKEKQKIKVDTAFLDDVWQYADATNIGLTAGVKSASYNMGTLAAPIGMTKTNIIDNIMYAEGVADEQSWPEDERYVVIPTWAKSLMATSDYKDESMTGDPSSLKGGRIGKIGRFKVYESNLYTIHANSGLNCYEMLFGHMSANCFVSQLVQVKYFDQLETTNGSGLKGLNVYDWKTVFPASLGVMVCYKAQN